MLLVNPFNHKRQATMLAVVVVLKKRMPSAPTGKSPLPLLPLIATVPRSSENASPVTRFHCDPGVARTIRNHSSPARNELAGTTNPSDPTRSDLNVAVVLVGRTPFCKYTCASPLITFNAVRQAPSAVFCATTLK